jgi:hypothetical protein
MGRSFGLGLTWSLFAGVALLACGGAQPAPAAPAEPGAAPAAEAPAAEGGGEDLVWKDDMPTKDKATFMKKKVMPAMSKTFQAFNAEKYANFGCKTCHGPDMKPKPSAFLPELHIKDGKLVEAADPKNADILKFMGEHVSPEMADIFGKPHYDPKTQQGFGCGGCHKMNM